MNAAEKEEIIRRLDRLEERMEYMLALMERVTGMWLLARWAAGIAAAAVGGYWWAADHIRDILHMFNQR